ncbi:MAG: VOC family protein [Bryobacteraceae bacterium]|nr:VOC family protein [Bryobacteraceae bacterium]
MVHELFAYLCVRDASAAVRFYCEAFGGKEKFRLTEPSGRVGHVEIDFNGITLMVSDEYPEYGVRAPEAGQPSPMSVHLHVDNADAVIERAVRLGATIEHPPADHFYGERSGTIRDPFGHRWIIGHSIETVTPEDMQARYKRLMTAAG